MFSVLSRPHCAVRPLALALSLLSISAHAEVTQLEDVVVTATREVTPIAKAPVSIGKINQQTLQDIKPTFIGQVVNRVPGVVMTDLGNEQHNMSIRQPMTYAAVYQYLEDGFRQFAPLGFLIITRCMKSTYPVRMALKWCAAPHRVYMVVMPWVVRLILRRLRRLRPHFLHSELNSVMRGIVVQTLPLVIHGRYRCSSFWLPSCTP
nr:hypothetical protein [uncultured Deefgea sp.]